MADTPAKPFPAGTAKDRRITFARIAPDGYVSATWRTWGILAGMLVVCVLFYAKIDAAIVRLDSLADDTKSSREALIKAGLLSAVPPAPKVNP